MAHAVRMPKPGQMTEECVLSMWLKAEGDPVAKGDILFEIETDKSTMEVESFHDGVLLRRVAEEGATVPVNAICAWIGEPGETVPETDEIAAPAFSTAAVAVSGSEPPLAAAVPELAASMTAPSNGDAPPARSRLAISPRAQSRAAEAGIDPRTIVGTGPGGRIVERDVLAAVAAAARTPELAEPARITPGPDEEPPRPLTRIRRVIAERLTLSATTIPTFTATVVTDVTRLLAMREEMAEQGVRVSVTDAVLAATAQTLAEFPDVNSRTDGSVVFPRRGVHLGVAVALPAGLVVAVIRDADRLDVLELHDEAARVIAGARDGTLTPDELSGSTFTVSNLGMYGVDAFTAIINPGESGILAVGSAVPTPVALNGGIAVRSVMKLTLTADHRLVDGELGARFLSALRRRLEDPRTLRRELAAG